jgi:hypothetical protein
MEFLTKLRHLNRKCTNPIVLEEQRAYVSNTGHAKTGCRTGWANCLKGEILGLLCMAMEIFVPIDPRFVAMFPDDPRLSCFPKQDIDVD